MYNERNPAPTLTPSAAPLPGVAPPPPQPGGVALLMPHDTPHTALVHPGRPATMPGPRGPLPVYPRLGAPIQHMG